MLFGGTSYGTDKIKAHIKCYDKDYSDCEVISMEGGGLDLGNHFTMYEPGKNEQCIGQFDCNPQWGNDYDDYGNPGLNIGGGASKAAKATKAATAKMSQAASSLGKGADRAATWVIEQLQKDVKRVECTVEGVDGSAVTAWFDIQTSEWGLHGKPGN